MLRINVLCVSDGWCVEFVSVTYKGHEDVVLDEKKWLDQPCKDSTLDGVQCSDSLQLKVMKCFLNYCNEHPDLRQAFCGGVQCETDVHANSCREHWDQYGKNEDTRTCNPVESCCTQHEYDPPSSLAGFYTHTNDKSVTKLTQVGSAVIATNPAHSWSPAQGTVVGNKLSLFDIKGTFKDGKISWSNKEIWSLQVELCHWPNFETGSERCDQWSECKAFYCTGKQIIPK